MWLVIYLRSYLVKYGELKQSLEMADKEREIDLKEREALVYRADSLQREFEHINKLLQVILTFTLRNFYFLTTRRDFFGSKISRRLTRIRTIYY